MTTVTRLTETMPMAKVQDQAALYATSGDFCRIFKEDMKSLYLLSLVLTADQEKAEQCFVSALDDCAAASQVFKERAQSWARRAIIKNAIRLIAPEPPEANPVSITTAAKGFSGPVGMELQAQISSLLGLQSFERFALVMSVLEGYSERECTLLLGCTRASLLSARSGALQQIARDDQQPGINLKPGPLHSNSNSGFGLESPARLECGFGFAKG
jgi:hypothetical protein